MKKFFVTTVALAFVAVNSFAQTLEEGIKYINYERPVKAIQTLQAVVNSKPKDALSIYWLGQAMMDQVVPDVAGAKTLYQQALNNGVNDPYIWIGMGEVELRESNNINSAKQRFEQAITATKKRNQEDPNILNAIGRAMAAGSSKVGDPAYAIEKLKRAGEIDKKNADIYMNLGVNYLKLGSENGGNAVEAFREAISRSTDPTTKATAMYRIGKIYVSQQNKESMQTWFGQAIATDPAFAPAYLAFFNWYKDRDVNAAKEYVEKYIANTDKSCETDYFYADYLYRAGKYQESLNKTREMENGSCRDYGKIPLLYAYNYNRLGDTVQAKTQIEKFFASPYYAKATPDQIDPDNYLFAASLERRFRGSEQTAIGFLQKALDVDTIRANRMQYLDTMAYLYGLQGKQAERLQTLGMVFRMTPNPTNTQIYNFGDVAFKAGNYNLADTMFNLYKQKYPDQVYGYAGLARVAIARDKDTTTGSAVPAVLEYIDALKRIDAQKYKQTIITNYSYLVYFHATKQKDYAAALKDVEGILAIDPENSYGLTVSEQLKKALSRPAAPARSSSGTKTTKGTK
ncbi:MAG: hypothetical protein JWN76_2258 [Chitinophagaceae bacterium]|nr:hypothetical protein [Chitinophagaceae bacterium]